MEMTEKNAKQKDWEEVELGRLFPGRHFLRCRVPAEIPADIAESIKKKYLKDGIPGQNWKNRENVRHADYDVSGSQIAIFPAIPEEHAAVPYWIEAFSVFSCSGHFFTRRERFASYMLLYTYAGSGYLEYGGKTFLLTPGDGFFIDCEKPHFYYAGKYGWQHSVLHLQGERLGVLYQEFLRRNGNLFRLDVGEHYQKNLQNLLELYEKPSPIREWLAADRISRLLTDLLERPFGREQDQSGSELLIANAVGFMEQHFTAGLSLDELSERFGVSRYYFAHAFKKYMGISPLAYLTRLRIGHAKILLESTYLPAARIAETVGISDLNHFYRQFKKYVGVTPGEYRKRSEADDMERKAAKMRRK